MTNRPLFSIALITTLCAATLGGTQSAWAQAASPAGPTPTPVAGCATVEVQNVRPQQGFLMVAAYADADSFGKKALASMRVPAGDATTRFELCGLTGGTVALTMYQDLDSDNKMGKNLLGMPTEPWGSSGNPGMFGPSWDTGKVALDGRAIAVRLSQ
jgi:uncharacterized protein (DUF2141 family)